MQIVHDSEALFIDKFTKLIMLWFVIPLIVLSPVYATEITSTSKTVCVRPTDQLHIHCDCHLQTETDCRTLDEWISVNGSSKVSPFTSNTTVILLAGVHLINSTKSQLLIEYVHSLVLTGNNINTTVTCIQDFSIAFVNSNHVSLSNITLNSCALRFLIVNNTQLINLSVINSRLIIFPKGEELGHYYKYGTVDDDEKQCEYLDKFSIIDSTFQNCPMSANGLSTLLYTSCVQINLSGVTYNNAMNSIYIMNAYNVILTNVTIYNYSSRSGSVNIFSVHKLVLQNMKIIQSTSNFLLYLREINTIKFAGDFIFKYNHGTNGIVMRQVMTAWTASNSTLRIENNLCRLSLFIFEGVAKLYPNLYIYKKSTLIFENNHVLDGAVMRLDAIHLHVNNSKIIFRRNKSLRTDSINSTSVYDLNAVLFLQNTKCLFSLHSTLNFSHNTAVLSGGITLFNSNILFVTTTLIYFEYNEGGDGGGMAFYKRSYIRRQQRSERYDETIDMHFYHNKAHGSGGAIFVKDADYVDVLMDNQYNYFVSTLMFIIITYSPKIHLHFSHNTAKVSGSDLYGGKIDSRCIPSFMVSSK